MLLKCELTLLKCQITQIRIKMDFCFLQMFRRGIEILILTFIILEIIVVSAYI